MIKFFRCLIFISILALFASCDFDSLLQIDGKVSSSSSINKSQNSSSSLSVRDFLIAEYLFDGNAYDTSTFGYHGTVFGAILTNDRFGNTNKAYYFSNPIQMTDGDYGQHINCGKNPVFDQLTDITVAVWANRFSTGTHGRVLGKCRNDLSGGWNVDFFTINKGMFSIASNNLVSGSTSISTSEFHYIVGTYNSKTGLLSLYVDGELVSSTSKGATLNLFASDENLIIGSFASSGYAGFNGIIDDVSIYSNAFSATEINDLYNESK